MARDRETGKFIPEKNSFDKTPFPIKMTAEMKEWVKNRGGSEFVRSLIQDAMDQESSPKQAA
ncbi:hypothetical protein H6G80_04035 [Nostoc sp. FACHB-87]|uniref:hypothetical protein n=1 Tax=Nostocaceae TaxID=1162 RepID=UPI001686F413|nr:MULTISPECIES: hypothetical protein [Nostocaceae]MBD2298930.1 hypothetical protein [Nostoc sp. FACHB-190]MBD2453244.1 hypothetical protein [Nostoc sp. FACHB-87]MBD2474976.1 hypothetical protein [Anabaena sp. FACHB-83]